MPSCYPAPAEAYFPDTPIPLTWNGHVLASYSSGELELSLGSPSSLLSSGLNTRLLNEELCGKITCDHCRTRCHAFTFHPWPEPSEPIDQYQASAHLDYYHMPLGIFDHLSAIPGLHWFLACRIPSGGTHRLGVRGTLSPRSSGSAPHGAEAVPATHTEL